MNVVSLFLALKELFKAGQALPKAHVFVNTASGASAIYALLSSLVLVLQAAGFDANIGPTDLHTASNGVEVLLYAGFAVWNQITKAGLKPHSSFDDATKICTVANEA